MEFRAGDFGAPVAVVVVTGDETVGPEVEEQLTIKRATHDTSPAMRVVRAVRERIPSLVLGPLFAQETLMVVNRRLTPGFGYRADERVSPGPTHIRRRQANPLHQRPTPLSHKTAPLPHQPDTRRQNGDVMATVDVQVQIPRHAVAAYSSDPDDATAW